MAYRSDTCPSAACGGGCAQTTTINTHRRDTALIRNRRIFCLARLPCRVLIPKRIVEGAVSGQASSSGLIPLGACQLHSKGTVVGSSPLVLKDYWSLFFSLPQSP